MLQEGSIKGLFANSLDYWPDVSLLIASLHNSGWESQISSVVLDYQRLFINSIIQPTENATVLVYDDGVPVSLLFLQFIKTPETEPDRPFLTVAYNVNEKNLSKQLRRSSMGIRLCKHWAKLKGSDVLYGGVRDKAAYHALSRYGFEVVRVAIACSLSNDDVIKELI